MLTNLNPAVVFINDKYINVERIYNIVNNGLAVQLDYFSGDKELIQFSDKVEMNKAMNKIHSAQMSLDFGTNYAAR